MKLAYIATDLNILKTQKTLGAHFAQIDYYLIQPGGRSVDVDISAKSILMDSVSIPADPYIRTPLQNRKYNQIESLYQAWKKQIFQKNDVRPHEPRKNLKSIITQAVAGDPAVVVRSADEISFMRLNRLNQKYVLELTKTQSENGIDVSQLEYDLVLVENNQFVMSALVEKQQNLFHSFTEQSKCLLTFQFAPNYLQSEFASNEEFILIDNPSLKSIDDNWYIVQMSEEMISASFYVPLQMSSREDYREFLLERVRETLLKHLKTVKSLDLKNTYKSMTNGFYTHRASLRHKKNAALMPCFKFWSEDQCASYLNQIARYKVNTLVTATAPKDNTI